MLLQDRGALPRGRDRRFLGEAPGQRGQTPDEPRVGQGPPRTCERIEGPAGYHDGAGLASPGRRGPEECTFPEWIRRRLLRAVLDEAGDPEGPFLGEAETGVTAGILHPMPRVPEMFEELTRWRLDQDAIAGAESEKGNYSSVENHSEWLREHLAKEVSEGRMVKMSKEELARRYGDSYAVAALAVLESHSGKKRLVHDGTHVERACL